MATAAVGKLWAGLDLKTGGYQKGLKKTGAMTKKSAKQMKSTFASTFKGNFLANLATSAFTKVFRAVGRVFGKVKEQFGELDTLAKFSRQLNISSTALVAWRQEAELAGTGAAVFDKGLEKLAINLGMAAEKGGPAADVLKSLNLDAKALAEGPLDQAFLKISDAISKQDNSIEKAFQTAQLFGKAGPKIALMMAGGADQLQKSIAQAVKDGRALPDAMLAGIEAANDAMTRLNDQAKTFFQIIAIALAPHVEAMADNMRDSFGSAAKSSDGITKSLDTIIGVFSALGGVVQAIAGALGALVFGIGKVFFFIVEKLTQLINKIPGVDFGISGVKSLRVGAGAGLDESFEIMNRGLSKVGGLFTGASQDRIDAIRAKQESAPLGKVSALLPGLPEALESQSMLNNETSELMSVASEAIERLSKPAVAATSSAQASLFGAAIKGSQAARTAFASSTVNPTEKKIEQNTASTAKTVVELDKGITELNNKLIPIPNAFNTSSTSTGVAIIGV